MCVCLCDSLFAVSLACIPRLCKYITCARWSLHGPCQSRCTRGTIHRALAKTNKPRRIWSPLPLTNLLKYAYNISPVRVHVRARSPCMPGISMRFLFQLHTLAGVWPTTVWPKYASIHWSGRAGIYMLCVRLGPLAVFAIVYQNHITRARAYAEFCNIIIQRAGGGAGQ